MFAAVRLNLCVGIRNKSHEIVIVESSSINVMIGQNFRSLIN